MVGLDKLAFPAAAYNQFSDQGIRPSLGKAVSSIHTGLDLWVDLSINKQ
jgi:hypothetical protein